MTQNTSSFNSLKFNSRRHRKSVSSPKMTIKTPMSWPLRIACAAIVVGIGGMVALWTYDMGRGLTGETADDIKEQLAAYKTQVSELASERDRYSTTVNAAESQLNIERSAQKQLALQVKALEAENARLKEDVAFFDSLLPNASGPKGIAIRRLKVEQVGPNQLRYRLLVMQGGRGDRYFSGSLQLAVTTMQDGKNAMMVFPKEGSVDQGKFKLGFKHYQRIEGVLTLPEGMETKSVLARVLENGQVRTQLSTNL
jgi:hypothetical protein